MVALTILFWPGARARAELVVVPSLEWLVADADLVVTGTVDHAASSEPGAPGPPPGTVLLNVTEVLRADPSAGSVPEYELSFACRPLLGEADQLGEWEVNEGEVMVFLVAAERRPDDTYAPGTWAPRDWSMDQWLIPLDNSPRAYTMDFDVLTDRSAIVEHARAAAAATIGHPESRWIDAPSDSPVFLANYAGSAVRLIVPVDARLEARAETWLTGSDERVALGVDALRDFRSPPHEAQLRGLLSHPNHFGSIEDGVLWNIYPIRQLAYDVLTEWGVAVPTPVTREPGLALP